MDLLTVEEAQERILRGIMSLPMETTPLSVVAGRVLAADLVAPLDLPPFANSSMDGFAVHAADLAQASTTMPVSLMMIGEVPAGGVFAGEVASGQTVRIFTGAPLPRGADAVLQQELTQTSSDGTVEMLAAVTPGTNVRGVGSDILAGAVVLTRGIAIHAAAIGMAAALGMAELPVTRRPRVTIIATGDELVQPGNPLAPGQIYESNAPMLSAAVAATGAEPRILPIARDRREDLRQRFADASADADLILTSGGVSVGGYDLVREVLAELGEIGFWRVNVRPGKPLAFGRINGVPLIGLPGNPVSSAVTFELFARPLLRQMLGCVEIFRPRIMAILDADVAQGDRRHYARARLRFPDGVATVTLTGDQGSHRIASLLGANALAIIPEGTGVLPAGAGVETLALWEE
jgi:molybdopterin molybdotransferase